MIHYIFSSESLRVVNSLQSSKCTTHTVFSMLGSLGNTVSTPRICIAIRLPFVRQYASHLYRSSLGKILVVVVTGMFPKQGYPEGPARHLDASRQKLPPHCLEAIFDSQFPSPKLSHKMPPKCLSPTLEDIFPPFRIAPVVRVIVRQLSGKNCLAAIFASRHQDASPALWVGIEAFKQE